MLERINHRIPDFLLKPNYRFYRHLLVQIVVLLITVNIFWDEPDKIQPGRLRAWLLYFLQINAIIYINMYLLVPRFLIKGKTLHYILSLPIIILAIVLFIGLFSGGTESNNGDNFMAIAESLASFAALIVFIVGLTSMQLFKYHLGNIRKIQELKNATMAVELANLQNQINPHFLFNTLNNANILILKDPEKSSYILKKLNDLLRYQTAGGSRGTVKLADDINFLNDYLNLEKTRRDRFDYTITRQGDCNVAIPALLFIPFVENAVKHNPENDSFVNIAFRVTGEKVRFECNNRKAELKYTRKEGGIGLSNVRKRLDLLFGNKYNLDLIDEKEKYTVIMEFKL